MKRRPFPFRASPTGGVATFSSVLGKEPWDIHTNGHILVAAKVERPGFRPDRIVGPYFASLLAEESATATVWKTIRAVPLFAAVGIEEGHRRDGFVLDTPIDLELVAIALNEADVNGKEVVRVTRFAHNGGHAVAFAGNGWRAYVMCTDPYALTKTSDQWPRILCGPRQKTFCAQCTFSGYDRVPVPCGIHEPMFKAMRRCSSKSGAFS